MLTKTSISRAYPLLRSSLFPTITTTRPASTQSTSDKISGVVVDQTKQNNEPKADKRDDHHNTAKRADNSAYDSHPAFQGESRKKLENKEDQDHPAKDPDAAEVPDRSTGYKQDGLGSKPGEGPDRNVHKETSEKPGPGQTWG